MKALNISSSILAETIEQLNLGGLAKVERVVLWLGTESEDQNAVVEAFVPIQETDAYRFVIPPNGMREILQRLRVTRTKIIAQVHSHPQEAFHSAVDDAEALVRHEGALSLVLPRFALLTSCESFFQDAAIYELSARDTWDEVPTTEVNTHIHE
jgi:hypothetical protein